MTIAIRQIALPPDGELELPAAGIVRHVAIGGEPRRVIGPDGKASMQELVILFVEYDPTAVAPPCRRMFAVLSPGMAFSPKDGVRTEFCGIGLSMNSGAVVYVYEVVPQVEMDSVAS